MCPVALLADAVTWLIRAGILLMLRLTAAVALAATAFSAAVLVAENFDAVRGTMAPGNTILLEVIDRPLVADANGVPIKIAGRSTEQ